jgi:hypothetical protein
MFKQTNKIKFYINKDRAGSYPAPISTKNVIPEWYKNAQSFVADKPVIKNPNGTIAPTGTVKKCMPFLDAMSAGYTIKLHADVYVETNANGSPDFTWTLEDEPIISSHAYEQVSSMPNAHAIAGGVPFKWMSPWHIQTPPGYSCLFVQPMNHREDRWEIISGIVDTDTFNLRINYPFIWTAKNYKGIIKQGTPIVQIIPFKRESWEMELINEDPANHLSLMRKLSSKISDSYKTFWWTKKDWR